MPSLCNSHTRSPIYWDVAVVYCLQSLTVKSAMSHSMLIACSVLVVLEKLSALITPSAAEAIDMDFRKRIYECKNDSFYELIQCVIDKVTHLPTLFLRYGS